MQLPNFLGVFSVLVLAVAWSASADEIVIMPIGDSITAGYHGSPSGVYRDLLQDKLSAENIPFDMVGEYKRGQGDNDHQGVPGASIEYMTANYGSVVNENQPDFALILAGTNNHWQAPVFDDFVDRYDSLLRMIRDNSSQTSIIISTVPKFGYDRPDTPYWTDEFVDTRNNILFPNMNLAINSVAERFDNVTVVDLYSEIDITTDLSVDGVHLNLYGQEKLGHLFGGEVIRQINAVPEPSVGGVTLFAFLMLLLAFGRHRHIKTDDFMQLVN